MYVYRSRQNFGQFLQIDPEWCGTSRSLYLFIRRAIKHIVVITQAYHFCQVQISSSALKYVFKRFTNNFPMSGKRQLLVIGDYINLWSENVNSNSLRLWGGISKEICPVLKADGTNINIVNKSF